MLADVTARFDNVYDNLSEGPLSPEWQQRALTSPPPRDGDEPLEESTYSQRPSFSNNSHQRRFSKESGTVRRSFHLLKYSSRTILSFNCSMIVNYLKGYGLKNLLWEGRQKHHAAPCPLDNLLDLINIKRWPVIFDLFFRSIFSI